MNIIKPKALVCVTIYGVGLFVTETLQISLSIYIDALSEQVDSNINFNDDHGSWIMDHGLSTFWCSDAKSILQTLQVQAATYANRVHDYKVKEWTVSSDDIEYGFTPPGGTLHVVPKHMLHEGGHALALSQFGTHSWGELWQIAKWCQDHHKRAMKMNSTTITRSLCSGERNQRDH